MSDRDGRGMRDYWDDKITWWAESSYEEAPRGFVEKFMANLRRSVHARAVIALELLKPHLAGKVVLDIGCGNGHFAQGCLELGARHVIGTDISPAAIELARRNARKNGLADKTTFEVGRAGGELPPSDFVTGFGLIDWLSREECMTLFRNIRGRRYCFSFSEQDGSFDEWVHHFYLIERLKWFGNGVRAHHHPRRVILNRLRAAGIDEGARIEVRKEMRFGRLFHNLNKT